jgi:hypothetical protein
MRAGVGKAIRNFIDTHNLAEGVTLTAEHPRGVVGVLSIFLKGRNSGPDEDRLNNPEVAAIVGSMVGALERK